jgi:hypothetical protein
MLCLTVPHMKLPEILQVNLNSYSLVTNFSKKNLIHGGVRIFVRNSLKFNQIDIMHLCMEQDMDGMLCHADGI